MGVIVKFKIRHKLFFTLFLTSTVVATGLFFYLQWSFDRGFLNYVRKQEVSNLNRLSRQLAAYYKVQDGWEFLSDNHSLWQHIHRELSPPVPGMRKHPIGPPPDDINPEYHPLHPKAQRNIGPRLILYDAQKRRVIGGPAEQDIPHPPYLYPIAGNEKVIGYLGLIPASEVSEVGDLLFIQNQTRNFALVTLVMVVLSILFTFPVASHLLRPIQEITEGTRKLIAGKFTTRIPVATNDELGHLSSDFNMLATTLAKNEEARRQWVADISHELRTPLSILRGEVEAILDGVRGLSIQNLEPLHGEVLHLERLVSDLYELSMSDVGALTYKKITVNPAGILKETLDKFEMSFKDKGMAVSVTFQRGLPSSVLADPDRLHQLFSNILENCLRYTDSPGKLLVSMKRAGKNIDIHFEDSAPGVEPQKLEKIFERLYRVDPSRDRGVKGVGLGLSICNNIVEAHGGSICAAPSTLGGLTLYIQLPLQQ